MKACHFSKLMMDITLNLVIPDSCAPELIETVDLYLLFRNAERIKSKVHEKNILNS